MNEQLFPAIIDMERQSTMYTKYFSTATSTLMVIGDIVYGGMLQYEQCKTLDYIPDEYRYSASLFDELKNDGYNTAIYVYPGGGDRESAEKRHLAGFTQTMELREDYSDYIGSIEQAMTTDQRFAIMACNYCSNLGFNNVVDAGIKRSRSGADYWKAGYQLLDQSVADIISIVKKKGKLADTLIVLYGDHGDDYWQHGMHSGLTHAIEPYANLIHTPLIIYDGTGEYECNDELISSIDLKGIIRNRLQGRYNADSQIAQKSREYVIARSAYAAQQIREDSFSKAYSITDGKYLLLVSKKGLEMYDLEMDPVCKNDFLRFFKLNGRVLINDDIISSTKFHFSSFMNEKECKALRQKFYFLREQLYKEVHALYETIGRAENELKAEMRFDILRSR